MNFSEEAKKSLGDLIEYLTREEAESIDFLLHLTENNFETIEYTKSVVEYAESARDFKRFLSTIVSIYEMC